MTMDPKLTPQAAREHPEPFELSRDVPSYIRVMIVMLLAWGLYYILTSEISTQATLGDRRTVQNLAFDPKAARKGGAADGGAVYAARCVACHQTTGLGVPGVFPPLAGSEWVTGKETVVVQIVLHGVQGPLTVKGVAYNGAMPAFKDQLADDEIAAVVSYIRSQWGNAGDPTEAGLVSEARAATASRTASWNGDAELTALR
jgi:mono/diheme cytochrome c family protein